MKNNPCPCGSGKKYRQCCWLRRFESAAPPQPPRPPAPAPPEGLYKPCSCGSERVYRRCCYPRTFPDLSKPNLGLEPHLDHAATQRAYRRLASLLAQFGTTIDTVDVGRTRVECAPLPNAGDTLPGTLAPPTPRQIEAKYDWIREGNPDGVTEVIVTYSYPDMFGLAEARIAFDADERFRLVDGRAASVLDLYRGMRVVMADGSVGTILGHPERRYDIPVPPMPAENGLWTSRVVGRVKHTAHEVAEFRWAGQVVQVTPGHEVWSADRRGWVGAHELRTGESIRVAGNVVAPVEGMRRVPGFVEVYGVEIEYFHNYFVGTGPNAMLVHNGPQCVVKPAVEEGSINATNRQGAGVLTEAELNPQHHVFPQEEAAWFAERGVDVDQFTVRLDKTTHDAFHAGGGLGRGGGWWNDQMMTALRQREAITGRNLTPSEIMGIGHQVMQRFGIGGLPLGPYRG